MNHDLPPPHEDPRPTAGRYLLTPIASQHRSASRALIVRAAAAVAPGRALVMGAGACDEIPLDELAARFSHVTLNDIARDPIERALESLGGAGRERIELHVADLTGATSTALERIAAELDTRADRDAVIARMAAILENQSAGRLPLAGKYDLVVASCLLSQLHFSLTHRAADLFARRFPGELAALRAAPAWTAALYQFARRVEAHFVDELIPLAAPGGLVYVSESVQMCYVELTAVGQWSTEGTFRMLRTTALEDYFDARFTIVERGRWQWVVAPPAEVGQTGRLYDVQSLVLQVQPAAC